MDRYPEYKFLSSQPQLYDFVRKDCPALFEKIRARVADGHWEPEGGMWLESDCNMASGESLIRQFLHGQEFSAGNSANRGTSCGCRMPSVSAARCPKLWPSAAWTGS